MNIQNFVENYHILPAAERKEGLSCIIKEGKLKPYTTKPRGEYACGFARDRADADGRAADFVRANIDGILKFLRTGDAKVRMHAQIIGNTCAGEYLDEAIDARLCTNRQCLRFPLTCWPSAGPNDRAALLDSYQLRSDLDKHREEEKAALDKGPAGFIMRKKARVRILPTDIVMLASPNPNVTYAQCTDAASNLKKLGRYIAISGLNDFTIFTSCALIRTHTFTSDPASMADLPRSSRSVARRHPADRRNGLPPPKCAALHMRCGWISSKVRRGNEGS